MSAALTLDVLVEAEALRRGLEAVLMRARDLGPALDDIGGMLVASTLGRFELSVGPDGQPWLPSRRARRQGGKTLVDRGRLMGSIAHRVAGTAVEVGSNVPYAAIHQFGGRIVRHAHATTVHRGHDKATDTVPNRFVKRSDKAFRTVHDVPEYTISMPPRPFLGIDAGDQDEVLEILRGHIRGVMAS